MFEHFTFGAQAQTNYDEDVSASPTDTSFPSPIEAPPQAVSPFDSWESSPYQQGLNDIVNQLSNHSLSHDSEEPQRSLWQEPQLPSPDSGDPFTEEELTYVSTTRGMAKVHHSTQSVPNTPLMAPSSNGSVACRRMQRQLNVQLQSCSNHVRDINALVEDMITSNSQCRLHKSTSQPYLSSPPPSRHGEEDLVGNITEFEPRPPSSRHGEEDLVVNTTEFEPRHISVDEDEGFGDFEDLSTLLKEEVSLRRASTPSGIRKYGGLRYRASAECVGANGVMGPNGRTKVRCVPRMRKRPSKVIRVPE
jgi:hypothetical protein